MLTLAAFVLAQCGMVLPRLRSVLSLISGAVEGAGRIGLVRVRTYGRAAAHRQCGVGTVGIAFSLVLVEPFVSHSIRCNHKPGGTAAHACEQVWPQPLPKMVHQPLPPIFVTLRSGARVRPARVSACVFCLCVFLSCPPVCLSVSLCACFCLCPRARMCTGVRACAFALGVWGRPQWTGTAAHAGASGRADFLRH
jgi:hypothetical protein